MDSDFLKIVEDIRTLRIQGATNIAVEGVKAFASLTKRIEVSSLENLFIELEKARYSLATARATEPALRNGLRFIIYKLHENASSVQDAKEIVNTVSQEYVDLLKESKRKVISYGAHRIKDGSTIMTHCHSSLSTGIILEAHRQGKEIQVFCTETRPLYQGRITAKELVGAGITTTQVVDSAMRWVINSYNVDIIITGADAITSQGTVINKIGTRLLALAAKEMDVPFYSAINLLKYDPETSIGKLSEIEMRATSEIWDNAPDGLNFLNPAFETISHDLIDGIISESGVFSPSIVYLIIKENYPFMIISEETQK
ncbi:MAG: S-methyl-5-thioribose-1-phosphate isomerase [Candidatus Heimdallarchaeota archaeon]|nr:S-methyl-5-thioribose-1-phosphate isomerase [Candidatus Heimdallarchaeota archaeon]MCK4953981.1 S-methyl-5-thioribose-1-phosphate isomerase [Candidatus Heimdallarchaeota archaeon]